MAEGRGTPTPKQEKEPDGYSPWWKRLGVDGVRKEVGWNWLELLSALAIPVVLAVAGLYFEVQLDERQRRGDARRAHKPNISLRSGVQTMPRCRRTSIR